MSLSRCTSFHLGCNSDDNLTSGKDVLAKARTGSGKTAAYAVPMIQKILTEKEVRAVLNTRTLGPSLGFKSFMPL